MGLSQQGTHTRIPAPQGFERGVAGEQLTGLNPTNMLHLREVERTPGLHKSSWRPLGPRTGGRHHTLGGPLESYPVSRLA